MEKISREKINKAMIKKKNITLCITFVLVSLMACLTLCALIIVDKTTEKIQDTYVTHTDNINDIIQTMYLCRNMGSDILLQKEGEGDDDLYHNYLATFNQLDTQMDDFSKQITGNSAVIFMDIMVDKEIYKESMLLSAALKTEGGRDDQALVVYRAIAPMANDFFESMEIYLKEEEALTALATGKKDITITMISIGYLIISIIVVIILCIFISSLVKLEQSEKTGVNAIPLYDMKALPSGANEPNQAISRPKKPTPNKKQSIKKINHLICESEKKLELGHKMAIKLQSGSKTIENNHNELLNMTRTMKEVAFQSNLLGLSASVEEARIGENKNEYVMIAERVRALSDRCVQVSTITTQLVKGMDIDVRSAAESAEIVTQTMIEVADHTHSIKILMKELASGMDEEATIKVKKQTVDTTKQAE